MLWNSQNQKSNGPTALPSRSNLVRMVGFLSPGISGQGLAFQQPAVFPSPLPLSRFGAFQGFFGVTTSMIQRGNTTRDSRRIWSIRKSSKVRFGSSTPIVWPSRLWPCMRDRLGGFSKSNLTRRWMAKCSMRAWDLSIGMGSPSCSLPCLTLRGLISMWDMIIRCQFPQVGLQPRIVSSTGKSVFSKSPVSARPFLTFFRQTIIPIFRLHIGPIPRLVRRPHAMPCSIGISIRRKNTFVTRRHLIESGSNWPRRVEPPSTATKWVWVGSAVGWFSSRS